MRKILALIVLLASVGFSAGCGGGFLGEPETTPEDARIRDLERQIVELKRTKTVAEVELARLRQEVARLRQELVSRAPTATSATPSTAAEETPEGPAVAPAPAKILPEEIETEDVPMEDDAPPGEARLPETSPDDAPPVPPAGSGEAQSLYDESYILFNEGRPAEAEAGFRRFLAEHPESSLADNASYWIGESRFVRGEYQAALEAFLRTIESYPQGNKVPDALFKAGRSLELLEDFPRARATYEEIRRRFPHTAAAVSAAERLEELP